MRGSDCVAGDHHHRGDDDALHPRDHPAIFADSSCHRLRPFPGVAVHHPEGQQRRVVQAAYYWRLRREAGARRLAFLTAGGGESSLRGLKAASRFSITATAVVLSSIIT